MPTEVKMPQLGESVHEGTIGKWLKLPGDRVAKYEPLVEVITDKVNVEMPSPLAGVLGQILVEEGKTVAAGTPIALIDEAGAQAARAGVSLPAAATAAPAGTGVPVMSGDGRTAVQGQSARGGGPRLSPLVRRLAEEHHLPIEELETIRGTGTGGRVTKDDVLRHLESRGSATPVAAEATAPAPAPGEPGVAGGPFSAPAGKVAPARAPGDRLQPLSILRRAIADRMSRSAREIPHAYGAVEVDVTGLVRHRDAHKSAWRTREGVNITLTAFVVRAVTRALRAYPLVNSTFTPEGILVKQAIHVGVGVAVTDGLIVPVIKHADQRSVVGIAREIDALAGRARQGKLAPDDIAGGTFTITNAGVYGSIYSMPIINHPQAAILSTDAVVRRPAVVGEGIAIRDVMNVGIGFDHRVFDGALALQFLTHIKRQLEEFSPVGESAEF
ncbi:MAG TPA: dihydrolipoamide acetyltransferase family protein [bacterium]|nr:dihydrolipoamide acetyltransferase family protein [bacterium]